MSALPPVRGVFISGAPPLRYFIAALALLACLSAHAQPAPQLHVMTPEGWNTPQAAKQVQVIRGTNSPFEPVENLKPTDRVYACPDTGLVVGSRTNCVGRAPGRTDIWWLVSDVFRTTPPPSPTAIRVAASWPAVTEDVNDKPLTTPVVYDLFFGQQGHEVLTQSDIVETSTTVLMEYNIPYCGWVVARSGGFASANGPAACHTVTRPTIPGEGVPKASPSIEFKTTVTVQPPP
jgi:hypothetical protein